MSDFNYGILDDTAHRPWPMPESPWVMTQTWHQVLFAHWPVDAAALRDTVPASFPIDVFDGRAWLGIVPFRMTNVAPRLIAALPWLSAFPELNVRTYVRVDDKPGVFFFSLDAGNPLAVGAARALLRLPYFSATMTVELDADARIHYTSRRVASNPEAAFEARYAPTGQTRHAEPGTLEHFLTERYCLYAVDHLSKPYRLDIHHPPWPLQDAAAAITVNTMAAAAGIGLPEMAPLLHYAHRQDTVAWAPVRID